MSRQLRLIFCAGCQKNVHARLVTGGNVYPGNPALKHLPFWRCYDCGGYVGCHHLVKDDPLKPLGVMATRDLRHARQKLHTLIDPIWKSGIITRTGLYQLISQSLGWKYHTAKTRSVDEAREVYRVVRDIRKHLTEGKDEDNGSTTAPG